MMSAVKTLVAALWAPALAGILAIVVTWLVWYYTAPICTPENALMLKCRPTPLSRYLSGVVLHHCIIHASIATTIVGGSDLMLFIRERRRNEQMMELVRETLDQLAEQRQQNDEARRQADEERRQANEERRQADEVRRQADEERRQANEERWRLVAEERRQAAEERRQADEERWRLVAEERRLAAEERRQADEQWRQLVEQAAEERQAFLEALSRLTDIIGQNRRSDA